MVSCLVGIAYREVVRVLVGRFKWHKVCLVSHTERLLGFLLVALSGGSEWKPKIFGTVMYQENCYWTRSDGWDPPPAIGGRGSDVPDQYNLRFSTGSLVEKLNLAVVLRPDRVGAPACELEWRRGTTADIAFLPEAEVSVFREGDILAKAMVRGCNYFISDTGIARSV